METALNNRGASVAVQHKDPAYLARNPDIIPRCSKRRSLSLTPSGLTHWRRKESSSSNLAEALFESIMEAQRHHEAPPKSETDNGGSSSSDSSGSNYEEEAGRPGQSINEARARWTATYDIALANAIVEQILQGKKTKNGFSKKAWAVIQTDFIQETGCYYTLKQIQRREGLLKMEYKVVKRLLGHPGFKWDKTRQMVIAEDAVWDDYLKAIPEAEKLRTLHFPAYDQFSIISGDVGAKLRLAKPSQHPSFEASSPDDTQKSAQEQADTCKPAGAPVAVQDKDSAYLHRKPDIVQSRNKRWPLTPSGSIHRRRKESSSSDLAEALFESTMEAQRHHGVPPESETANGASSSDSSSSSSEEEAGKSGQSINEERARWTATYDIALANAMVEQILQGKKTKNCFSKKIWAVIQTDFIQETGCYYTLKQIQRREGLLKMQYKVVKRLLGHPGFKWDKTRQMVIAEDSVWDDYLKAIPEAEKFRTLHFPVYDQFSIISGDVGAKHRLAKSSQHPSLEASTLDDTQKSAQKKADVDKLAGAPAAVQDKDSAYLARNPNIIQRCNKRRSLTPSGSSYRRRKESSSSDLAEALFDIAEALRCKRHASPTSGDPYGMSKCIKELESMKGVTDEDVFGAINVFRDPLLREAFFTMQPQRRLRWIRTQLNMVP